MRDPSPRQRRRLRSVLASSMADQALASVIALALTLVSGRRLGPGGLGAVAFGLAVYHVASGFHRALILDPLIVKSTEASESQDTRAALVGTLVTGSVASTIMVVVSLFLGGDIGRALAGFAPWVIPALVVDAGRVVSFRDGRRTVGMTAHIAWLSVMLIGFAALGSSFSVGVAASCWGAGALAGALVSTGRLRYLPLGPSAAWAWWTRAWPMGRWLALQTAVYSAGVQGSLMMIGVFGGLTALGSFKAAQTLVAPLTFLFPAVTLPALPVVTRTLRSSKFAARRLTRRLTFMLTGLCATYLAGVLVGGDALVGALFGESLEVKPTLMLPIALHQLVVALSLGSFLLIKASSHGRDAFVATALGAATTLTGVLALSASAGAVGGAWAIAFGGGAATLGAWLYSLKVPKEDLPPRIGVTLAPARQS